jgi:hypothetical protein
MHKKELRREMTQWAEQALAVEDEATLLTRLGA